MPSLPSCMIKMTYDWTKSKALLTWPYSQKLYPKLTSHSKMKLYWGPHNCCREDKSPGHPLKNRKSRIHHKTKSMYAGCTSKIFQDLQNHHIGNDCKDKREIMKHELERSTPKSFIPKIMPSRRHLLVGKRTTIAYLGTRFYF